MNKRFAQLNLACTPTLGDTVVITYTLSFEYPVTKSLPMKKIGKEIKKEMKKHMESPFDLIINVCENKKYVF